MCERACAYVGEDVSVGARERTCACGRVALFSQHARRMRHIVSSLAVPYFSTLSHKRHEFQGKNYEYGNRFDFP